MINDKSLQNLKNLKDRTPEERHRIALMGTKKKADSYKRLLNFKNYIYSILAETINIEDNGKILNITKKEYLARLLVKRVLEQLENDNIEKLDIKQILQVMQLSDNGQPFEIAGDLDYKDIEL